MQNNRLRLRRLDRDKYDVNPSTGQIIRIGMQGGKRQANRQKKYGHNSPGVLITKGAQGRRNGRQTFEDTPGHAWRWAPHK